MPASFRIFIKDYETSMSIGIYGHEKKQKQRVIVNIQAECELDVSDDDIKKTVSYEDFVSTIERCVRGGHYNLIETFAEEVSLSILKNNKVSSVEVSVEKPDIFKGNPKSAGVSIMRFQT